MHYSLFTIHLQCGHSGKQALGVSGLWVVKHRIGRAIFHHAAAAHHRYIICQVMHHTQVMRNENHSDAHIPHQVGKQVEQPAGGWYRMCCKTSKLTPPNPGFMDTAAICRHPRR